MKSVRQFLSKLTNMVQPSRAEEMSPSLPFPQPQNADELQKCLLDTLGSTRLIAESFVDKGYLDDAPSASKFMFTEVLAKLPSECHQVNDFLQTLKEKLVQNATDNPVTVVEYINPAGPVPPAATMIQDGVSLPIAQVPRPGSSRGLDENEPFRITVAGREPKDTDPVVRFQPNVNRLRDACLRSTIDPDDTLANTTIASETGTSSGAHVLYTSPPLPIPVIAGYMYVCPAVAYQELGSPTHATLPDEADQIHYSYVPPFQREHAYQNVMTAPAQRSYHTQGAIVHILWSLESPAIPFSNSDELRRYYDMNHFYFDAETGTLSRRTKFIRSRTELGERYLVVLRLKSEFGGPSTENASDAEISALNRFLTCEKGTVITATILPEIGSKSRPPPNAASTSTSALLSPPASPQRGARRTRSSNNDSNKRIKVQQSPVKSVPRSRGQNPATKEVQPAQPNPSGNIRKRARPVNQDNEEEYPGEPSKKARVNEASAGSSRTSPPPKRSLRSKRGTHA